MRPVNTCIQETNVRHFVTRWRHARCEFVDPGLLINRSHFSKECGRYLRQSHFSDHSKNIYGSREISRRSARKYDDAIDKSEGLLANLKIELACKGAQPREVVNLALAPQPQLPSYGITTVWEGERFFGP